MFFYKLPVLSVLTKQGLIDNGVNIATYGEYDLFLATDAGDVYVAKINTRLAFVSASSGLKGYWTLTNTPYDPTSASVVASSVEGVYDIVRLTVGNVYTFHIDLFTFSTEQEMLEQFYNIYVGDPDIPETDGIVVRVIAYANDSNDNAGTSEESEGLTPEEGGFDDTSDEVPPSELPSVSGTDSGLVTLFRPTQSELNQLGEYLWTNITDFIENLNKLFMNPMDYIVALNVFPVMPPVGTSRAIHIGSFTTSINMPPLTGQFMDVDCGTILIPEYWGSYLDYSPYTKIHAMLPFVGSVTLNTDEVMNQILGLKYRIDMLSGQCVAMITINNSVYYQYSGECAVAVPVTGADWSRIYSAAIGAVGSAITGGASAAVAGTHAGVSATAAMAQARAAQSAASAVNAFGNLPGGVRGVQAMRQHAEEAAQMALQAGRNAALVTNARSGALMASRIANTVDATVGHVVSGKGHIQHSGTVAGNAAMLGVRTPYVMLEYPNQSLPENYKHFVGYPSNMYASLGSLSGFTACEQVITSEIPNATDGEIEELLTALKEGVYL